MALSSALISPEERRAFPRIVIDRDVLIMQADGGVVRARAYDLSPDGLKLLCDIPTAQFLRPPMDKNAPGKNPIQHVRFEIPLAGGMSEIRALCRVTYVKLAEDKQVAVGLKFKAVIGASRERLERFFAESLEPM